MKFTDKSHLNYPHPEEPRYINSDIVSPKSGHPKVIRVVSYNIWFGVKIPQAIKLLRTNAELKKADILCLQEMDHDGVEKIARELKYNYVYYPAIKHKKYNRDFGNAILSKWPIQEDQKIILPHKNPKKYQRIAVCANVTINQTKILLYSVHLNVLMSIKQRAHQASEIVKSVPKRCKQCIITGDFNTISKKAYTSVQNEFVSSGYNHASESLVWTYKHWYLFNKKVKLDHIFIKGLTVSNVGKVETKVSSDHYPIWADILINTK